MKNQFPIEKLMASEILYFRGGARFCSILQAGGSPDWISFAAGIYDLMRPRHRTAEFEIEYKFHVRRWGSPFHALSFFLLWE